MLRTPAVSGRFYPSQPEELTQNILSFIEPVDDHSRVIGIVVPHAGYMYSGHVAGAVYSRIVIPPRVIVLCPNHTGFGPPLSIMSNGAWQTPLGSLEIDDELSAELMQADGELRDDATAHRFEHATEVQLPFLQHLAGSKVRFVPITVGTGKYASLELLGKTMGEVLAGSETLALIISSSDMNHYESDDITRVKDRKAIDQVLALDPEGLFDTVRRENISMCGYGPTVAMLVAARSLGASKSDLVRYATSGDVSGDFDRVVGYAGMTVY
jgi:AmmeMemoRadiSam system protein B